MEIYTVPGRVGREDAINESLTQMWMNITHMSEASFIGDESKIWFNPNFPDLGMWVLNHRSSHVRIWRTGEAGWAVMDRTRVRVGTSKRSALERPHYEFRLKGVPSIGGDKPRSTILISHNSTERVRFLAGSAVYKTGNGICTYDPFTCIDLPHYTRINKRANSVEAANAHLNGAALLTYGMSPDAKAVVYDNIDSFGTTWGEKHMAVAMKASKNLSTLGRFTSDRLHEQMRDIPYIAPNRPDDDDDHDSNEEL